METSGLKLPLLLCPRWPLPPKREGTAGPPLPSAQGRPTAQAKQWQGPPAPRRSQQPLPSYDHPALQAGSLPFPRPGSVSASAQSTGTAPRGQQTVLQGPSGHMGQPFVELGSLAGRETETLLLPLPPHLAQVLAKRPEQKAPPPASLSAWGLTYRSPPRGLRALSSESGHLQEQIALDQGPVSSAPKHRFLEIPPHQPTTPPHPGSHFLNLPVLQSLLS